MVRGIFLWLLLLLLVFDLEFFGKNWGKGGSLIKWIRVWVLSIKVEFGLGKVLFWGYCFNLLLFIN